jgi:hypothetical protein
MLGRWIRSRRGGVWRSGLTQGSACRPNAESDRSTPMQSDGLFRVGGFERRGRPESEPFGGANRVLKGGADRPRLGLVTSCGNLVWRSPTEPWIMFTGVSGLCCDLAGQVSDSSSSLDRRICGSQWWRDMRKNLANSVLHYGTTSNHLTITSQEQAGDRRRRAFEPQLASPPVACLLLGCAIVTHRFCHTA